MSYGEPRGREVQRSTSPHDASEDRSTREMTQAEEDERMYLQELNKQVKREEAKWE